MVMYSIIRRSLRMSPFFSCLQRKKNFSFRLLSKMSFLGRSLLEMIWMLCERCVMYIYTNQRQSQSGHRRSVSDRCSSSGCTAGEEESAAWSPNSDYNPNLEATFQRYIHIFVLDLQRRAQINQLLRELISVLEIVSLGSWIHTLIRNDLSASHPPQSLTDIINSRFGPDFTFSIARICHTTCFGYF